MYQSMYRDVYQSLHYIEGYEERFMNWNAVDLSIDWYSTSSV